MVKRFKCLLNVLLAYVLSRKVPPHSQRVTLTKTLGGQSPIPSASFKTETLTWYNGSGVLVPSSGFGCHNVCLAVFRTTFPPFPLRSQELLSLELMIPEYPLIAGCGLIGILNKVFVKSCTYALWYCFVFLIVLIAGETNSSLGTMLFIATRQRRNVAHTRRSTQEPRHLGIFAKGSHSFRICCPTSRWRR
jgi:hypothetical protein